MKTILFVFGTRPEAIKMAPLIKELQMHTEIFKIKICVTAQHREMLDQVLDFFDIRTDYDLNIMKKNQTLFDITFDSLNFLEGVLSESRPDLIFVQGDTTTAFTGALAGFYKKTKVAHLEAGLRSGYKFSPYPEEINRVLVGHIADYHFAPTKKARENLMREGIQKDIYVVGNTVVDALFMGINIIKEKGDQSYQERFNFLNFSKRIILVTGHRRESFGEGFENICLALKEISVEKDIEIVYPVHMNPNVREPVNRILKGIKNIYLIEPLDYPYFIWLMYRCYLVLTDSGGVQEEAPSLGKPILVMREVTERTEGIEAGTAKLVGVNKDKIANNTRILLNDQKVYNKMAKSINPYGNGNSSRKIVDILKRMKGD